MGGKTTEIYLIRHGESQANEKDVFLGHGDLDLTEKGRKQAELTAEYLKDCGLNVVYSSDLLRAYHTAEATAKKVGLPIIKDERLREINAGKWDFKTFNDLEKEYKESYDVWLSNIGLSQPDGGESVADLQKRVLGVLEEIAKNHVGQKVAVFTHATPIRCLQTYSENKKLEEMKKVAWVHNASVSKVRFENGKFIPLVFSFDEYLGELRTLLPDNV